MSERFRIHEPALPHFITNTISYWIPVFCRDDYFRILTDSLTYCVENKGLRIHAYVIMPNHSHAICSHPDGKLSDVIRDLKKHTSKAISAKLKEDGRNMWLKAMNRASGESDGFRVWDEAFHPEQIYSKEFCQQKMDYIHNNPVRAGFVTDFCAWKYSSAGYLHEGLDSVVPIVSLDW